MNLITTRNNGSSFYFTPDTSLNRDSNDYFCPENVEKIAVVPFFYAKIQKPAKCVNPKFSDRYISSYGYGFKLVAKNIENTSDYNSYILARSLDNSIYISDCFSMSDYLNLRDSLNKLSIKNNEQLCNISLSEFIEQIPYILSNISNIVTLRTGDMIVYEGGESYEICKKNFDATDSIFFCKVSAKIVW